MAVTLPSWLQIDPIAPARIKLQANAQRQANAAREQAARQHYDELEFRREQAAAQQAAQDRSERRRLEVMKQTHDAELAQQAAQNQLRRERQAMQAEQFQQQLRLKEQKAQQEAAIAAKRMEGMQAVQKGLQAGQPIEKLIAQNAPNLFAGHENQIARAVPAGAMTGPVVARQLMNEQGQPTGQMYVPGARGGVHFVPPPGVAGLKPEGQLQADKMRLGVIMNQLREADNPNDISRLEQARDAILQKYEPKAAAPAAPVAQPVPGAVAGPVATPPAFTEEADLQEEEQPTDEDEEE